MKRRGFLWWAAFTVFGLIAVAIGAWGALALHFQATPRLVWISLWLAAILAALTLAVLRGMRVGMMVFTASVAIFTLWWSTIRPTNDQTWLPPVAQMATAEFRDANPSFVTLHNVRNFDWRTADDYTPRWESRTYDLNKIATIDAVMTYWMGPAIAHMIVSFGFSDGQRLAFSIETRLKVGQSYSAIDGFFKCCELVLVAGDERDLLRLRTNVRGGEEVYLYHVRMRPERIRELFLDYALAADALAKHPKFYNTLTTNCTTMVFRLVDEVVPGLPMDYRLILSGYVPEYLYDLGALDQRYSLDELHEMGHLNRNAALAAASPDYSSAIRTGIPPL